MTQELILHSITAIYAVCNVVRLLFYVPQMLAVARDPWARMRFRFRLDLLDV